MAPVSGTGALAILVRENLIQVAWPASADLNKLVWTN
jgi:hypothetical protein